VFRCHNAVYIDCFVCLDKLIKFFFLVCLLPDFQSGEIKIFIGVNLVGILWDAGAYPEGLVGDEEWGMGRQYPSYQGRGLRSEERAKVNYFV